MIFDESFLKSSLYKRQDSIDKSIPTRVILAFPRWLSFYLDETYCEVAKIRCDFMRVYLDDLVGKLRTIGVKEVVYVYDSGLSYRGISSIGWPLTQKYDYFENLKTCRKNNSFMLSSSLQCFDRSVYSDSDYRTDFDRKYVSSREALEMVDLDTKIVMISDFGMIHYTNCELGSEPSESTDESSESGELDTAHLFEKQMSTAFKKLLNSGNELFVMMLDYKGFFIWDGYDGNKMNSIFLASKREVVSSDRKDVISDMASFPYASLSNEPDTPDSTYVKFRSSDSYYHRLYVERNSPADKGFDILFWSDTTVKTIIFRLEEYGRNNVESQYSAIMRETSEDILVEALTSTEKYSKNKIFTARGVLSRAARIAMTSLGKRIPKK